MNIYPYVYKLVHRETGQFYIGYRCANKVPAERDLGVKYFSSSKTVKAIGFESFDFHIIAEFFSKKSAIEFEDELIRENWDNPLKLNKHRNGVEWSTAGTTKVLSAETKMKMSIAHTGLIRSDAHRKATSESLKGHRVSPETAKKISDANKGQKAWNKGKSNTWLKGKTRSAETKAKISAGHKLRNSSVGFSC